MWSRQGVRVDVNEELKFLRKFKINFFWGEGGGVGVGLGGQGGCERRIEVFAKIQKKKIGGGGVGVGLEGVRVDVKVELKFFRKCKKMGGGGPGVGSGPGEGGGLVGGVRVDVNEELKFCEN